MKNNEPKSNIDPTLNVREMLKEATERLDDLRKSEVVRINESIRFLDEKFSEKLKDSDAKYQIQFVASKEAVTIASTAQKELVAQALSGTKEAITKNDTTTDKRFELQSDQIRALTEIMNKSAGAQGIYVTHTDLSIEMEKLRTSFETMLRPVITFMNNSTGGKDEVKNVWGYVVGAVGLASTIILLIMRFVGN